MQKRMNTDLLGNPNYGKQKWAGPPADPRLHHGAMIESPADFEEPELEKKKFNYRDHVNRETFDRI